MRVLGNRKATSLLATGLLAVGIGVACSTNDDTTGTESANATECTSPVIGVNLQPIYRNLQFNIPTSLVISPDTKNVFVVEKAGVIKTFAHDNLDVEPGDVKTFVDLRDEVNSADREPGINGLALHPKWPDVPEAYITYDGFPAGQPDRYEWRLSRFKSKDGGKTLDRKSEVLLISILKPASEHNGGQAVFHPTEGLLYVSVGDSEVANGPEGNAQNTSIELGKFLRIDVLDDKKRAERKLEFDAPEDNPFAIKGQFAGKGLKTIYSWGHRNPWRWSFDPRPDGKFDIWSAEVGQESFEEIDLITKGGNYGWNIREGSHNGFCDGNRFQCGKTAGKPALLGVCDKTVNPCNAAIDVLTDPLIEVPHRADKNDPLTKNAGGYLAASVTGGFVYRGKTDALKKLVGKYIYADFESGGVFAAAPDPKNGNKLTPIKIGSGEQITSFQQDVDGDLLALGFHGGLYKLVAGACPQAPDPNARQYAFLSKQGVGTEFTAWNYYKTANKDIEALAGFKVPDPPPPNPNQPILTIQAPSFTQAQWKAQFMPGELVSALYKNDLDLGFWRQMSCSKELTPGRGGCAVTNWPATDPKTRKPIEPLQAELDDPDATNLGTVTMNISPEGFTRFYVFAGKAPHLIQPFAVLDNEGEKFAPQLCTPCHGGRFTGGADIGSVFREFEPAGLVRRANHTQDQAQAEWFALNQVMLGANKALKGSATTALAADATRSPQKTMLDYIETMYPQGKPPAVDIHDPSKIPASFLKTRPGVSKDYITARKDIWTKLIAPYCLGCHKVNNTDLSNYSFVQNLAIPSGDRVLMQKFIEPQADDPTRQLLPIMPQAAYQSNLVLLDTPARDAIDAWVAQLSNPNVPQCAVTINVSTFFGAPDINDGEIIRVLGQTLTQVTDRPDPLSNWNPAAPGFDLVKQPDNTWLGTRSFPQGASIEFKAVVGKNEGVRVERNGQGNRTFNVPNVTTTRINFQWQN